MKTWHPPVPTTMPRRTVLRGAAGTAIALPLLEIMLPKRAHAQAPIKRFVAMFSPNGTVYRNWTCGGTGTNFTLSRILKPLEPVKDKIVVIDGLDQSGGGGDGHLNGVAGFLTGQTINPTGPKNAASGGTMGWARGISIDQYIANAIGKTTKFKSLEFGVETTHYFDHYARMSFSGPEQPIPPENDPSRAFTRIFSGLNGGLTVNQQELERLRLRKQTVLDGVAAQFGFFKNRLGRSDLGRVEEHLTAVREIEMRLGATSAALGPVCTTQDAQKSINLAAGGSYPNKGKLQMDLLVMALKCDLTRVATIMWSASANGPAFTWLGINDRHHTISHKGDSDTVAWEQMTKIEIWYAQQYAYMLQKMASIPEPGGSLLDNSLLVWGNELGQGNNHSRTDAPYVLAGRAAGSLQTGRNLKFTGAVPHNNLLVAMSNLMGVRTSVFGPAALCKRPLGELV